MRELKFRAWDNIADRFLTGAELSDRLVRTYTEDGESRELLLRSYIFGRGQDLILMQYTGLKDKNGKEIYEGDIVKVSYRGEKGHPTAIGWVDYLKPRFIVRTKQDTEKPLFYCLYAYNQEPLFNWAEGEVIGNIYENPELLKP